MPKNYYSLSVQNLLIDVSQWPRKEAKDRVESDLLYFSNTSASVMGLVSLMYISLNTNYTYNLNEY